MSHWDETDADPVNHPRPATAPDRYGYRPVHDEKRPCLRCGKIVTYDEDMGSWWVPYTGTGNVPRGHFECPDLAARHMGSLPRMGTGEVRKDPRLRLIADMVAYLHLHIGAQHIRDFTTEQNELYADLVDADNVLDAWEDPSNLGVGETPLRVGRTWRGDYAGPRSPDDPRWHSIDRHEPDAFAWAAEPLARGEDPDGR